MLRVHAFFFLILCASEAWLLAFSFSLTATVRQTLGIAKTRTDDHVRKNGNVGRDFGVFTLKQSKGGGGGRNGGVGGNGNNSAGKGNNDNDEGDGHRNNDIQISPFSKSVSDRDETVILTNGSLILLRSGASLFSTSSLKFATPFKHNFIIITRRLSHQVQSILSWYLEKLETSPLITKSITSGIIGITGDALAQIFQYQYKRRSENPQIKMTKNDQKILTGKKFHYNGRRGFAVFFDDTFISGPLMHVAYNVFEHFIPITNTKSPKKNITKVHSLISNKILRSMIPSKTSLAALSHVLADMIFLDSIFIATSFITSGILEGYSLQHSILPQLQSEYVTNLKACASISGILLPLEFTCFRYLPVRYRALAMKGGDIIWDGVVSFMNHRNRH